MTAAAETAATAEHLLTLPRDLLFDILVRLGPAALGRIRCVSASLRRLLDTTDFVSLYHRKHFLNPLLLFLSNTSSRISCYHYNSGSLHSRFDSGSSDDSVSVFSCDGVVCVICMSKIKIHDPVIRRSATVRFSNGSDISASTGFAFGFAKLRREYKIVRLFEKERFDRFHYGPVRDALCEIVSIPSSTIWCGSKSERSVKYVWRTLGIRQFDFEVLTRKGNVCVDGTVYWLIGERRFNPVFIRILSFDLETECFGIVCFPREYSDRSVECVGLLEMEERLCMTDRLPWETKMVIWMLCDEGRNIWCKKCCIDLSWIDVRDFEIVGHVGHGEGREGGEIVIKIGNSDFVLYDVEKCLFRRMEIAAKGKDLQVILKRKGLL
ncbi:hypothetical protein Drorol1_Dr00001621 [Drosera rotundifolia]